MPFEPEKYFEKSAAFFTSMVEATQPSCTDQDAAQRPLARFHAKKRSRLSRAKRVPTATQNNNQLN
jgi:hypothetical protein